MFLITTKAWEIEKAERAHFAAIQERDMIAVQLHAYEGMLKEAEKRVQEAEKLIIKAQNYEP